MKHYTFRVNCSFEMQFTFSEDEVEQKPEGDDGDVEPTEKALKMLEGELEKLLCEDYSVTNLEVSAESDDLLGSDAE